MAAEEPSPTPGGPALAVVLCLLPLAFLVVVTLVKRLTLPTRVSLPAAAAMMALIRLAYLSSPPALVAGCFVSGMLEAITPLSIITGAILLFQTMDHTGCLEWIMGTIKDLSGGHPVAEVFLIGFAFSYLVEGASGFGTPTALAAPMLAGLGHDPVLTVVTLLLFNGVSASFGAVGTPIWFGFSGLGLGEDGLRAVAFKAALVVGFVAATCSPLAASFLIPWRDLLRNLPFVMLSILAAVIPSVAVSLFSYDFPTLVGGLCCVAVTALLVRFRIGLRPMLPPRAKADEEAPAAFPPAASRAGSRALAALSSLRSRSSKSKQGASPERAASGKSYLYTNADLDDEDVPYIPPRLGSVPIFPMPMDVQVNLRDKAVQADEGAFERALAAANLAAAANGAAADAGAPQSVAAPSPKDAEAKSVVPEPEDEGKDARAGVPLGRWLATAALRTLPLTGTVLLLLITRVPQLRVKGALQAQEPRFLWRLGTLGDFGISASLVVQLLDVLRSGINWKYEVLYVPALLPFAAMSVITLLIYRRQLRAPWRLPFREAFSRVGSIAIATFGALVLVQLIRHGGRDSPAYLIGYYLSGAMAQGFLAIGALLGAVGSFFSGSTTVSDLTFAEIQAVAAERLGLSPSAFLAVQVAGAAIGNAFTISNVLAAKAVMGLQSSPEALFLKRTLPVGLLMCLVAQAFGLIFTLGGALSEGPPI